MQGMRDITCGNTQNCFSLEIEYPSEQQKYKVQRLAQLIRDGLLVALDFFQDLARAFGFLGLHRGGGLGHLGIAVGLLVVLVHLRVEVLVLVGVIKHFAIGRIGRDLSAIT
jgi:hypothetical protein